MTEAKRPSSTTLEIGDAITTAEARATLDRALIDVFDTASLLAAIAASPASLQSGALHPLAEVLRRAHNDAVGATELLAEACATRGEVAA